MLFRMLAAAPRNASIPIIAILAGWYGGAKYGAPDYVLTTIDGMLAQGGDIVGGLLPGAEGGDAPADSDGSEV